TRAVRVTRGENAEEAERTAAAVLVDEVARRTGIHWPIVNDWPSDVPKIAITTGKGEFPWTREAPRCLCASITQLSPEGFLLLGDTQPRDGPVVWIVGADSRGSLFGV